MTARSRFLRLIFVIIAAGCAIAFLMANGGDRLSCHPPRLPLEVSTGDMRVLYQPQRRCSRTAEIDRLTEAWGTMALSMGEGYMGSGTRTRAFLQKLMDGKPVILGILGGSVTFGHGLDPGELSWGQMLFDWINTTFPHAEHRWTNGAVPATGTDYFAACYDQHVPGDADLYVVESAINDEHIDRDANSGVELDVVDYTETLTRELLANDPSTAMIMLSAWSVPHPYLNGGDKHNIVAEYYDVPRLTTRPFLYKYLMQHNQHMGTYFSHSDFGHQNQLGHLYMAQLVIWYLEKTICQMEVDELAPAPLLGHHFASNFDTSRLPQVRIKQWMRDRPLPNSKAFCLSSNIHRADQSWGLTPSRNDGWRRFERYDKSWWIADEPGATITFSDIEVHGGSLGVFYLRSQQTPLGNLYCWADDDRYAGRVLKSWWEDASIGSYGHVRSGLSEGLHSVTCEVMHETDAPGGEHHVRIIAIMAS